MYRLSAQNLPEEFVTVKILSSYIMTILLSNTIRNFNFLNAYNLLIFELYFNPFPICIVCDKD